MSGFSLLFFRHVAGSLDGTREPLGRAFHADVGRVVVRRPPLRDDHLRQLPLPGPQQQPGAGARQGGEHALNTRLHQESAVSMTRLTFFGEKNNLSEQFFTFIILYAIQMLCIKSQL